MAFDVPKKMYETFILINPDLKLNIHVISEAIRKTFTEAGSIIPDLNSNESSIKICWPNFLLELNLVREHYVLEESSEMASSYVIGYRDGACNCFL